ncbi:hypothetical protein COU37_02215 [Candidatus Micrarchaeota archaeon CG10_big_fil_rev_8_21_14_0_10_45_29]|nr:MAG: hypothetical protein COU37_02215 [Candidatus Micrarchaeota archaeon CG10_big_fil_rev_8_21_14_0_10_45_29]
MPISNNFTRAYSSARQFSLASKRKLPASEPKGSSIFDNIQPVSGEGVYCPPPEKIFNPLFDKMQPLEGKGICPPPYPKERNPNHNKIKNDPKNLMAEKKQPSLPIKCRGSKKFPTNDPYALGVRQLKEIKIYERQSTARLIKIITGNFTKFSKMQAIQKLGKKDSRQALDCLCSIALREKKFEWQGIQKRLFSKDESMRLEAVNSIASMHPHHPAEALLALKNAKEDLDLKVAIIAAYFLKKITTTNGIAKKTQEPEAKKILHPKEILPGNLSETAAPQTKQKKRIYPLLPLTEHIINTNYPKYM